MPWVNRLVKRIPPIAAGPPTPRTPLFIERFRDKLCLGGKQQMEYLDVEVQITPGDDARFDVRVASAQGSANATFDLPLVLSDLYGVVHGLHPPAPAPEPPAAPLGAASAAGLKLFQALFQNLTRDILTGTEARAREIQAAGVRIRLNMDLSGRGMAQVASLPWELMCRGKDDHPLAISTRSTFVRSVDTDRPVEPRPFKAPLRILALKSNPKGTTQLDLQTEAEAIGVSWAQLDGGKVVVDVVKPVPALIRRQLDATDYHVIHYMGHGGFYPEYGGGHLMLEDEDGTIRWTPAVEFAAWLADKPPRLVFLNACETGTTAASADQAPIAGVATALIHAGLTAVVGMQFAVSDTAATTFSTTFYDRLVMGHPIDTAVAEARLALYPGKGPVEWATPVLYMRSYQGELIPDLEEEPTMAQDPDPRTAPPASSSQAGAVSIQGGINISGSFGSGNTFGDNATVTNNVGSSIATSKIELPRAEDVDMAAVMRDLKALLAEAQAKADPADARKIKRSLETVDDEIAVEAPSKVEIVEALTTAVEVAKKSVGFAEQLEKLTPHVIKAAGWIGATLAVPLLKSIGL